MAKKLTFEAGMEELEALVKALESGTMPLEDSFQAFGRAVKLKESLEKLLDEGDARIRLLTEKGEKDFEVNQNADAE